MGCPNSMCDIESDQHIDELCCGAFQMAAGVAKSLHTLSRFCISVHAPARACVLHFLSSLFEALRHRSVCRHDSSSLLWAETCLCRTNVFMALKTLRHHRICYYPLLAMGRNSSVSHRRFACTVNSCCA